MYKLIRCTAFAVAGLFALTAFCWTGLAQKTIKDPAEYNDYIKALNTPDNAQKAAAMEAFATSYPSSVVKVDALEQAMAAYQSSGVSAKVLTTAQRILEVDPNNIRALAVVVFMKRNAAAQDPHAMDDLGALAAKGLNLLSAWTKDADMSDADLAKLKSQMATIFNGAAGFAALQANDYAKARQFYSQVVQNGANDEQDIYQYAIAELAGSPIEPLGFWYGAKAANLAKAQKNDAAFKSIEIYARAVYKNYHGSDSGWDSITAAAAMQTAPPTGFTVAPKATPAEIAVQAVLENDPASLSFSDDEFILSYRDASPANKAAADKVWAAIQSTQKNGAVLMNMPVKVISATTTSMTAAMTDENQQAKKVDLEVTFATPMTAAPTLGTTVELVGYIADYRLSPFVFVMKKARILH
jgi:tetratricopeptide (TPR) repeat protein